MPYIRPINLAPIPGTYVAYAGKVHKRPAQNLAIEASRPDCVVTPLKRILVRKYRVGRGRGRGRGKGTVRACIGMCDKRERDISGKGIDR